MAGITCAKLAPIALRWQPPVVPGRESVGAMKVTHFCATWRIDATVLCTLFLFSACATMIFQNRSRTVRLEIALAITKTQLTHYL
jgi:hypothetical protein